MNIKKMFEQAALRVVSVDYPDYVDGEMIRRSGIFVSPHLAADAVAAADARLPQGARAEATVRLRTRVYKDGVVLSLTEGGLMSLTEHVGYEISTARFIAEVNSFDVKCNCCDKEFKRADTFERDGTLVCKECKELIEADEAADPIINA